MGYIIGGLIGLGIVGAGIVGWVMNIIKVFGLHDIGAEFVIRIIGIFLPFVGAVGGYF